MKVTVNFGSVRVIVPCGKGDLPVKQLMDLAITRYKKATGKSLDSWVTIHNLKLLSDGGILDPDDKLNDVADDREQITAIFDEEISPYLLHNGGDGTSASSIGTDSPDIFQNVDVLTTKINKSLYNSSDVEITNEKISCGLLPLHVRRGSEPALNQLPPSMLQNDDNCKRWSAAVLATSESYNQLNSEGEELSEDDIPGEREDGSGEEKSLPFQDYIIPWNHESHFAMDKRKEPLGGPISSSTYSTDEAENSDSSGTLEKKIIEVMKLKNEEGPLGIRIVPADDSPEKHEGVIIEGIEPGGRIDRDGRFSVGDRITEINGLKLSKDSYRKAQEMLKDAMKAPELNIHCIKKVKNVPNSETSSLNKKRNKIENNVNEGDKANSLSNIISLTPTKKLPASLLHKGTPGHSSIRKIGRKILVHLTKGPEGLGFSITSKDPNNGPPFFIKNILPAGAAVDDGRLKTGDKLIEVNKVDVSNMTQSEVLNILRKIPFGDVVELVISRQETDLSPSPNLPRQLPQENADDDSGSISAKKRDIFTYEVPLNDTGSAGLGVSVKGKTSNTSSGAVDKGIFIKNIFHGGAAHKDGRLCNNDQLLNVNGISLLAMTNGQAMETLRRAMIQNEGPKVVPNAIILTVARRVPSPVGNSNENVDSVGHDRSDSLLSESGDSFYVSNENLSFSKCNGQTPDTSTSDQSNNTVIHITSSQNFEKDGDDNDNLIHFSPRDSPPKFSSVLDRLTTENNAQNLNSSNQIISSKQLKRNCGTVQENVLLDIARFDDQNANFLSREGNGLDIPVTRQKSPLTVTQNSPSNHFHEDKSQRNSVFNVCDIPPNSRTAVSERPVHTRKNNFNRSGLGRQSMPEKMFSPSYQRNNYLSPNKQHENNFSENKLNINSSRKTPTVQQEQVIREMPVDVGPCEYYGRPLTKLHRSKGSCDSPDCPYHAVPLRRESGSSEEAPAQIGPSLGLFKSSSLESLQTFMQEQQKQSLPLTTTNAISTRGCNESFRAAVDKSFEANDQAERIASQNSNATRNHTRAKTVDVASTDQSKKSEKTKKKGLFRGLGSVFRFGKSSKKGNKEITVPTTKEFERISIEQLNSNAMMNNEQNQTHCKEVLKQLKQNNHPRPPQNNSVRGHLSSKPSFTFPRMGSASPSTNEDLSLLPSLSRQERMNVLRSEHQRRHQKRNGFYPQDNQEEVFEQHLMQTEENRRLHMNRPLPPLPHQQNLSSVNNSEFSPKTKSLEMYREMSKPGSRKGFADPIRYSHYMNFQEIQQHLQQFRIHQGFFPNEQQPQYHLNKRHYRHTVSSPRSRPISEFIDLTNTEVLNHSFKLSESGSLPRRAFANSKQRLPIPAAFMFQQEQNGHVNRYDSNNYYDKDTEDHLANGNSSKV